METQQVVAQTHFLSLPYVYQLSGDLNVGVLEKSIGEIVQTARISKNCIRPTGRSPLSNN